MDDLEEEPLSGSDLDDKMDLDDLDGLPQDDPEEDDELGLDQAGTHIWLVKVPTFLSERWSSVAQIQDGVPMGTVEMPPGELDPKLPHKNKAKITLPATQPWSQDIPKNYTLAFTNLLPQKGYVFTANTASDRPKEVVGRITHEATINPVVDADYRNLMHKRTQTAAANVRTIQLHDPRTDSSSYTFIAPVNNVKKDERFGASKKIVQQDKRERMEKQELINLIFTCFEKYAHWGFKGLLERTDQPQSWLKEVLNEVAFLNKRGPYMGLYELKAEFKGSASASDPADGNADAGGGGSSGTGGNLRPEDGEGEGEESDGGSGDEDFEEL
ncbi:hypothetical protein HKX48_008805 [Thoreauomyces humboldtii]|nr:hypothetical protein HKX48_008805 [Thoreauomyces humboldtii]